MTGSASFHSGLDIAAVKGQPVYATADGTVTEAGYHGAYGKSILINHGFGLQTRYGHLLDYTVKLDDRVKRGDVIGRVGATGRATGYHLHYEVMANGQLLNPLRLLSRAPRGR
jgi:murein DD-endopeptidase MepM/ murein hydrolase activator NlpD